MKLLSAFSRWYKLRRHRLGLGVHSPMAYRVVRDVIYGKGYYYSVARMARLTAGYPKRMKREYEMIFRLIARLAPDGVRLSDGVEPQVELLVRMADMRPFLARGLGGYRAGKRVLTICDAIDLRNGVPQEMLLSGNMAVVRRIHELPGAKELLLNNIEGGWLFADKRMAIVISNENEPKNVVDVKMA